MDGIGQSGMNKRIQQLAEQAGFYVADGKIYIPSTSEEITTCQKKFAELIVKECAEVAHCNSHVDGWTLGNVIKEYFGVKESNGWVCPKCGVDRTQAVCPRGDTAALTGECPMIGVAQ